MRPSLTCADSNEPKGISYINIFLSILQIKCNENDIYMREYLIAQQTLLFIFLCPSKILIEHYKAK